MSIAICNEVSPMNRWHVIQAQPSREYLAREHLEAQGFEIFLPECITETRLGRTVITRKSPLFRPYLFTRFDPEENQWRSINGTRGVNRLLCCGDHPRSIRTSIIQSLIDRVEREGGAIVIKATGWEEFQTNARVRINAGPFAGHEATYLMKTATGRVKVLLDILGGPVQTNTLGHWLSLVEPAT